MNIEMIEDNETSPEGTPPMNELRIRPAMHGADMSLALYLPIGDTYCFVSMSVTPQLFVNVDYLDKLAYPLLILSKAAVTTDDAERITGILSDKVDWCAAAEEDAMLITRIEPISPAVIQQANKEVEGGIDKQYAYQYAGHFFLEVTKEALERAVVTAMSQSAAIRAVIEAQKSKDSMPSSAIN